LKIFRDGKFIEKKVTLRARDEESTTLAASDRGDEEQEIEQPSVRPVKFEGLGLSVRPLTSDEKKQAEIDRGVMVSEVKPYSEAFNRALRENDIIIEADQKEISSPSDLKKIIDSRKPGDSVLLRVKKPGGATTYVALQISKD
jgi:serine protease Do